MGQKVKAVDTATGKTVTRAVSAVWIHDDTDLMDVTVTSGGVTSTIHATQHHPFWDLTTHTWVEPDNLKPGDQLRADNGTSVTFSSSVIVPGAADMWDLTIDGVHDFYIATGGSSILVHNEDGCDPPQGVIYKRTDASGLLKDYVGQAKSETRFLARQGEHAADHPDSDFSFEILGRANPGQELDVAEETAIREFGGPTNLSNPLGALSNWRHQMNNLRYLAAVGASG